MLIPADWPFAAVIQAVYDNVFTRAVLGLIAANILVGVAASLYTRTFRLGAVADWLLTRAIPYLLGAGVVQLVLLTVPPEWSGFTEALGTAVWLFVVAALVGHILEGLREIGLPIPATLGAKPGVETRPTT